MATNVGLQYHRGWTSWCLHTYCIHTAYVQASVQIGTPFLRSCTMRVSNIFHTRSDMMAPSNGNIFGVTGPCVGNSPVTGEVPSHRPLTRSFDVFFDLRLNKRLSKQLWGWWFETPSPPLWRHCNDTTVLPNWVGVVDDRYCTFQNNTTLVSSEHS